MPHLSVLYPPSLRYGATGLRELYASVLKLLSAHGPRRGFPFVLVVLCDDLAIEEVNGSIRITGKPRVVGYHANRGASLMQFGQQIHYRIAIFTIQVTGRLVR